MDAKHCQCHGQEKQMQASNIQREIGSGWSSANNLSMKIVQYLKELLPGYNWIPITLRRKCLATMIFEFAAISFSLVCSNILRHQMAIMIYSHRQCLTILVRVSANTEAKSDYNCTTWYNLSSENRDGPQLPWEVADSFKPMSFIRI